MIQEYQDSILTSRDSFKSIFPSTQKITKSPAEMKVIAPTFTAPTEPKVLVGVSAIDTEIKESHYNYFRPLMVIFLISVFAVVVFVGVWIFYRTYNSGNVSPGSASRKQQIDSFMGTLTFGVSTNYGTAGSIITAGDCNEANNCLVDGNNFNCVTSAGVRQWLGGYCQIPAITSGWVISLISGDESKLGDEIDSGVKFPTETSATFLSSPGTALVYYNTAVGTTPKKTYAIYNQTGIVPNTNTVDFYQLIQDPNTKLSPFNDFTRSRLIYVKNLQNVYYGPNQARLVFTNVPSLYEFLFGGDNVQILEPGVPYNVSRPYSIYNINGLKIRTTTEGVVNEFTSQFIPLSNPTGVVKVQIVE